MAKVKICETVLRDSHQSLIATRMRTEDMLPILEQMDKVGYHALEAWGGATFESCLRFLDEDPWDRLRKIRDKVKNTKLQMLFRGQNILGYRHYSDDVVEYFVQKSIANGIDILRQRPQKPQDRDQRDHQGRRSRSGGDQLHDEPRSHERKLRKICKAARRNGRTLHLYQGYGRSSQAL